MTKEALQSLRNFELILEIVKFGHLDHLNEFKPYGSYPGWHLWYKFANGYGASVIRWEILPGSGLGGSYSTDHGLWELAVLDNTGDICYTTPVADDVIGWLAPEDVNRTLSEIETLPPITSSLEC